MVPWLTLVKDMWSKFFSRKHSLKHLQHIKQWNPGFKEDNISEGKICWTRVVHSSHSVTFAITEGQSKEEIWCKNCRYRLIVKKFSGISMVRRYCFVMNLDTVSIHRMRDMIGGARLHTLLKLRRCVFYCMSKMDMNSSRRTVSSDVQIIFLLVDSLIIHWRLFFGMTLKRLVDQF